MYANQTKNGLALIAASLILTVGCVNTQHGRTLPSAYYLNDDCPADVDGDALWRELDPVVERPRESGPPKPTRPRRPAAGEENEESDRDQAALDGEDEGAAGEGEVAAAWESNVAEGNRASATTSNRLPPHPRIVHQPSLPNRFLRQPSRPQVVDTGPGVAALRDLSIRLGHSGRTHWKWLVVVFRDDLQADLNRDGEITVDEHAAFESLRRFYRELYRRIDLYESVTEVQRDILDKIDELNRADKKQADPVEGPPFDDETQSH